MRHPPSHSAATATATIVPAGRNPGVRSKTGPVSVGRNSCVHKRMREKSVEVSINGTSGIVTT